MSNTTEQAGSWAETTEQEEKKLTEQAQKLNIADGTISTSSSTANLAKSLSEQMDDPNNPLYSKVKSFNDFPKLFANKICWSCE